MNGQPRHVYSVGAATAVVMTTVMIILVAFALSVLAASVIHGLRGGSWFALACSGPWVAGMLVGVAYTSMRRPFVFEASFDQHNLYWRTSLRRRQAPLSAVRRVRRTVHGRWVIEVEGKGSFFLMRLKGVGLATHRGLASWLAVLRATLPHLDIDLTDVAATAHGWGPSLRPVSRSIKPSSGDLQQLARGQPVTNCRGYSKDVGV